MPASREAIGLGLESSCDETAAAIIRNGKEILSNLVYSQIHLHRVYSGVVPEIASRAHLEVINDLIQGAVQKAGVTYSDLSYVAATNRPGLVGSLLIALQSAKAVSFVLKIPLIASNHLESHLYAPFLEGEEPVYPHIGLLVSGGNTALYQVNGIGETEIIGKTADDAVGEAFDKVAKYLDLGYPGGPVIEKTALTAVEKRPLFPKILSDSGADDFRFSYSGLKTSVITYIRENPDTPINEVVYSFQERALELLVRRVYAAARKRNIKHIVVAGGVAANGRLREMLDRERENDEHLIIPSKELCTDNAAMVAGIGYHYYVLGQYSGLDAEVYARS